MTRADSVDNQQPEQEQEIEPDAPVNTFVQETSEPPVDGSPRRSLRVRNQQRDSDNEYEIEFIVAKRTFRKRLQYKVRYTGYGAEDDRWRPAVEVEATAPELVAEYERLHPE